MHKPVVGPGSEFLFRIRIHQNNSDPFCYGSTTLLNRIIYFKSLTFICVYDVASGKLCFFKLEECCIHQHVLTVLIHPPGGCDKEHFPWSKKQYQRICQVDDVYYYLYHLQPVKTKTKAYIFILIYNTMNNWSLLITCDHQVLFVTFK